MRQRGIAMDLVGGGVTNPGSQIFDFGHNEASRDEYTDAWARTVKAMQTAEGYWAAVEGRRARMNAGCSQSISVASYNLKTYGPPAE